MLKWDCQFGMYDKAERAYYAIGKPDPKHPTVWQLWPMYFLLQLFTLTTAPGWKVLPVVRDAAAAGSGTKHLVAFKGSGTNLTIIGLDHRGAHLNKASRTPVSYEIGGLGAGTKFALVLWNKTGGGKLHLEPTVVTANAGRCGQDHRGPPAQRVLADNEDAAPILRANCSSWGCNHSSEALPSGRSYIWGAAQTAAAGLARRREGIWLSIRTRSSGLRRSTIRNVRRRVAS